MNIRGFGGIPKQKSLTSLFYSLKPDMILIQETRCDHFTSLRHFSKLKPIWKFCALDSHGLSGGLLSSWNPHITQCKAFHSFASILLKDRFKGDDYFFSILNYYGPYTNRVTFWDNVLAGGIFKYPNLILDGDLNFTFSDSDIWGINARMDHMVHYFKYLLDSSNMVELNPYHTGPTWRNGRTGTEGVSKRLERFLVSLQLIPVLNSYHSWIHPFEISHHYPVCLEWSLSPSCHNYPFKFNRAWLLEQGFPDIVHSSWNSQLHCSLDPMTSLTCKLKSLKVCVKDWEKKMNLAKAKEETDIDLAIQVLLTTHILGILSVCDSTQLTQLKERKRTLLIH